MVNVTIGTNLKRESHIVESGMTLREVLEAYNIDYTGIGGIYLDGMSLSPGDLDKSFEDLGIGERCTLLKVQKADNA